MKKLLGISSFSFFTILFGLQTSFTSCTKEITVYDTVTVTKTDTLVIRDTAISLGLITAHAWRMQEVRGVYGNTPIFYQRGGTTNTENYNNEYILFKANKTGTLFDASGGTSQISWDFSNVAMTKLTFIAYNAALGNQSVVYENIRYQNNALYFDQYWTYQGVNSHAQVIRIQ